MAKGGLAYNQRSTQIIRMASLLVPVVLIVYGSLIQRGLLVSTHYTSDGLFAVIAIFWTLIAVILYLFKDLPPRLTALSVVAYHIFAALFLVAIAGVSTPAGLSWLILFLIASSYFGKKGLYLSMFGLAVTTIIDMASWATTDPHNTFSDFLTLIILLIVGLTTTGIMRSQAVDKKALHRSQAQESLERERLLTLVNNLADAILSTDTKGVIRVYNAACLNLLDTNDSLNGRHISDVLQLHDSQDRPVELFEELHAAKSVIVREDLHFTIAGSEKVRLEITYSPIRSSYTQSNHSRNEDGYIIILRDITKQKSLDEERDEFISVVSHELRTPITIVEGTLSNTQFLFEHGTPDSDGIKKAVDTAHEQVIYLAKMVNDLSTLSRAERGVADDPEEIDVKDLIHTLYKQYEQQALDKGLHLNLSLGTRLGSISVSRLYIEELLQNFITNAIKYTVEGSVTLSAHVADNCVTFSVQDSGIGMSKTDQKHIFDKFYRAEDYRTRETSGTGLGLYVAAKLARKMGTKIELDSRLNHGSTFSFTLPLTTKK